jgi:hypothetical protein
MALSRAERRPARIFVLSLGTIVGLIVFGLYFPIRENPPKLYVVGAEDLPWYLSANPWPLSLVLSIGFGMLLFICGIWGFGAISDKQHSLRRRLLQGLVGVGLVCGCFGAVLMANFGILASIEGLIGYTLVGMGATLIVEMFLGVIFAVTSIRVNRRHGRLNQPRRS